MLLPPTKTTPQDLSMRLHDEVRALASCANIDLKLSLQAARPSCSLPLCMLLLAQVPKEFVVDIVVVVVVFTIDCDIGSRPELSRE